MLVSIVIPAFNSVSTIGETIDSVISQTFDNWEAIVVDDGSTDGLRDFLKKYTDPRLKYFYKENGGVASARNLGIKIAEGDYIAFLDSDDIWRPEKLLESINKMTVDNSELIYSDISMFESDFNFSVKYKYVEPFDISNDYERLLVYDYIPTLSVVVKKSVFLEIGDFDETLKGTEDWDMWIRIAKFYKISYLNKNLSYYRSSSNGLSKGNRDRHLMEEWKVIKKHIYDNKVKVSIRRRSLWVWNRKMFYNHFKLNRYFNAIISYLKMLYLIPFKKENIFLN